MDVVGVPQERGDQLGLALPFGREGVMGEALRLGLGERALDERDLVGPKRDLCRLSGRRGPGQRRAALGDGQTAGRTEQKKRQRHSGGRRSHAPRSSPTVCVHVRPALSSVPRPSAPKAVLI